MVGCIERCIVMKTQDAGSPLMLGVGIVVVKPADDAIHGTPALNSSALYTSLS
jgi:hypothetical protein